jgi:hypothetical protein
MREFLRRFAPNGSEGFVVEDLDLMVRTYGPNYYLDSSGRFVWLEVKFGMSTELGVAQVNTFKLPDELMRRGDPEGHRYRGFYILRYQNEAEWTVNDEVSVNKTRMKASEFVHWLEHDVPFIRPCWTQVSISASANKYREAS